MYSALIIKIYKDKIHHKRDECFAKVYYEFARYTASVSYKVYQLMKNFPKSQNLSDNELARYFVRQLERQGGGLYQNDHNYYTKLTNDEDYSTFANEDDGIIAFSKECQNELKDELYDEQAAIIYLDEFTFTNPAVYQIHDLKKYCDNHKRNYEKTKNLIENTKSVFNIDKEKPLEIPYNINKNPNSSWFEPILNNYQIYNTALRFDIDKDQPIEHSLNIYEKLRMATFIITSNNTIFECIR